jgi:hypothetical protein
MKATFLNLKENDKRETTKIEYKLRDANFKIEVLCDATRVEICSPTKEEFKTCSEAEILILSHSILYIVLYCILSCFIPFYPLNLILGMRICILYAKLSLRTR